MDFEDSMTYAITPNEGHYIEDILVDGVSVGAVSEYAFDTLRAVHVAEAAFAAEKYNVSFIDSINGDLIDMQEVEHSAEAELPKAPAHDGYMFISCNGNYDNVTADEYVVAYYALLGDVNMTGYIDATDALLILRNACGLIILNDTEMLLADFNLDGVHPLSMQRLYFMRL